MHRPGEGVFGRGSNVLDYWLANSEGFTIARPEGKRRVSSVLIDPETRQARSLVIRRSRRRTVVVAADRVTAVDPHGRVLYLAQRRRRRTANGNARMTAAPALRAARGLQHGARASARHAAMLQPVASTARAHARSLLAVLGPLARAYAHNAMTISVIVVARTHAWLAATLRGRWKPTWQRFSTRRARRLPAVRSRMRRH